LLLVPEEKVRKLDMSVTDGIKYVVSLGAIVPGPARAASLPREAAVEIPASQP
jgi:uncharacterized membrane protein